MTTKQINFFDGLITSIAFSLLIAIMTGLYVDISWQNYLVNSGYAEFEIEKKPTHIIERKSLKMKPLK